MDDFTDLFWDSVDGLRLHARDYPAGGNGGVGGGGVGEAGPPILCLHGLTRNARDFEAAAPWLAAHGHRVLAADVRGRGGSAWDRQANYRLPVYADDARRLLAAAGIDRALIVGTSMGGLIAMELASTDPGLIAGAVVNDVGPVLGAAGLKRIAAYAGKPVAVGGWADAADHARRQNEQALPHYRADDWAAMARRLFREADGALVPDYDPAIAQPAPGPSRSAEPWAQWAALAACGPVLLLRGTCSDLLDAPVAAAMAGAHRNVTLAEVPGVGHAPMLDEPAARAAMSAWLERSRAG